ncbi:MAG: UDP-N-acetylglucosamine 1-carboxyvinyltransferase, partial [Acidimicrobiales bacterium]
GEVLVEHARTEHMDMLIEKLGAIGVRCVPTSGGILASSNGELTSVDISTLPYPGVATDYKPALVALLSVASGVAIVSENVFAGRFRYVDELQRMGARISTEGHHVVVRGVNRLSGARVRATDIRAGAALVIAGLVAEGETEVAGAEHVDRGYEDLAGRLRALGADVERLDSPE